MTWDWWQIDESRDAGAPHELELEREMEQLLAADSATVATSGCELTSERLEQAARAISRTQPKTTIGEWKEFLRLHPGGQGASVQALGLLEGWAQICAYLHRDERWCRKQAGHPTNPLPVFPPRDGRGRICARPEAIDAWAARLEEKGYVVKRVRK